MSRLSSSGTVVVAPTNNVYTALAAISFLATLGAMIYVIVRFNQLGVGLF